MKAAMADMISITYHYLNNTIYMGESLTSVYKNISTILYLILKELLDYGQELNIACTASAMDILSARFLNEMVGNNKIMN